MINNHFSAWEQRGPASAANWLFAPSPARHTYITADALSHKFRRLGLAAGVANPALHRIRHGVATHLADQGKLLKAQARLGHHDPSTTLRHYSHSTMLNDRDIADELDTLLNRRVDMLVSRWAAGGSLWGDVRADRTMLRLDLASGHEHSVRPIANDRARATEGPSNTYPSLWSASALHGQVIGCTHMRY